MTSPRQPFRLTPEQYQLLMRALDKGRVGRNPKGFSHLEAWDVRRWLIRVFGFGGFDVETISLDLVKEIEKPPGSIKYANGGSNEKTVWTTVYRAQVRLIVWDQYGGHAVLEDGACGDSVNQPSLGDCHDNAMKTALSQALKRAAVNLGDCFGLGLYNDGNTDAVVIRTAVAPEAPTDAEQVPPVNDAPVLPEPRASAAPPHAAESGSEDAAEVPGPPVVIDPQLERRRKRMFALFGELGHTTQDQYRNVIRHVLQRDIASSKDMSAADVERVIAACEQRQRDLQQQRNGQRQAVAA